MVLSISRRILRGCVEKLGQSLGLDGATGEVMGEDATVTRMIREDLV